MNAENIKTAGVIGSGTMGRGIGICTASAGIKTVLYDINSDILDKAALIIQKDLGRSAEKKKISPEKKEEILKNIVFTSDFTDLKESDFVIEAALENMELKKDLFSKLDELCGSETILSTNTS